jgi:hypothetical protein
MREVLIVVLIALVAPYVLGPVLTRFTQTIAMWPRWVATSPQQLTPAMHQFIGAMVAQFHAQGFEFRCNVHVERAVPGVAGFQVLLVHPITRDIAVIIVSKASLARSMIFSVRSEFVDGTMIATGVNPGIGMFPTHPAYQYENFPWVQDAETLIEAHRRILAARGRSNHPRVAPTPGGEIEYMTEDWRRGNERHVESGYRYPLPERGVYAFTTLGAILATWKLAWPVKRIRIAFRNRNSRQRWTDLDMGNWHPHSPLPLPALDS